ncbi:MAG: ferrous iron transport protein B [Desulfovibrionaceae bacterium]|nr:ferrous iron transport protein B [Desulfovibrionaceae bacterium]
MSQKTIAIIGNPNCGKSTLFNALTGAHQHVGNYPGITVEKHEGTLRIGEHNVTLVDLPGTYSLTAYSLDELVARNFLVNQNPDAVMVMVDATNLERSLYLALQIREMGKKIMLVLNMMDEVRRKGMNIDMKKLAEKMQSPVVGVVARTGEGKQDVLDLLANMLETSGEQEPAYISYGTDLNPALERMENLIQQEDFLNHLYPPRWLAVKYMERDTEILSIGEKAGGCHDQLKQEVDSVADHTIKTLQAEPAALVADYRYGYISSLLRGVISHSREKRFDVTDAIDKILCNPLLGPFIMLGVLYSLFWITIELGAIPQGWVETFFEACSGLTEQLIPEGQLLSLINDGIIAGVGGVLSFAPLILIMFFFLSFLEDSGYLARMAYMLDKVFHIFGLHGASVVPFIVAGGIPGGCAVPGIMAARTLRSPRERIATILTAPFLSCGAKTPVFLMIAIAFFPQSAGNAIFFITLAGWFFVLLVASILRHTIISGPATPFVMELPPYRLPTLQGLLTHTWERAWMYIKKAGTVILAISVLIWASMTYPGLDEKQSAAFEQQIEAVEEQIAALAEDDQQKKAELEELKNQIENNQSQAILASSYAGQLGKAMETVTKPLCGFDWRTDIALIGGFAAKEVIISTLGTAYSLGEVDPGDYESAEENETDGPSLASILASDPAWSQSVAIAFILFVLLYSPCFVTIAVIGREIGWKWAFASMFLNTFLAFAVAALAYRICPFLMH